MNLKLSKKDIACMTDLPIPSDNWKRMSFKGNKVWAETGPDGSLKVEQGKVRIQYNLEQNYQYRVKPENLKAEDQALPARDKSKRKPPERSGSQGENKEASMAHPCPEPCIRIYTDGASSGNPGPAGIGILFIYGSKRREISSFIGHATNNIAELTAIKVALQELKRFDLPVRLFSDSSYALGLLTKEWKARANKALVSEIRSLMEKFTNLEFIKVKGHSGIKENEVADFLATSAIKKACSENRP